MIIPLDEQKVLEKLKRRHGIVGNEQDVLMMDFIEDAMAHYLAIASDLAGELKENVPAVHSFMIVDVASKRYIRRGSEGLELERVDQYQAKYGSPSSDFEEYMSILAVMYEKNDETGGKGRVVFY